MDTNLELTAVAKHAHVISVEQALKELHSDVDIGLSDPENKKRLDQFGPNEIPEQKGKSALERLWEQVNSVLIYILVVGAILSFSFHHTIDGIVIIAVVVLNVILGFYMESQAVNATETLQKMMSLQAQVIRDGYKQASLSISLTLGDLFVLRPGDVVPADGRVIKASSLAVQEASLTGESLAVTKDIPPVQEISVPLAERHCMVYSGTQVLNGTATCVTTATGGDCEIGKISRLLAEVKHEKTSLLIQLEYFGRVLSVVIITLACLTFVASFLRGYSMDEALSIGIGVAVAAIPEGLPSCITVAFAIGVRLMAQKNAIVKSLPAVETLGSVSVICSDKTGTLTMNAMEVQAIVLKDESIEVGGGLSDSMKLRVLDVIFPALLCNNASVVKNNINCNNGSESESVAASVPVDLESQLPASGYSRVGEESAAVDGGTSESYRVEGSSTEASILKLALKCLNGAGGDLVKLLSCAPRVSEIPFDSSHKFMATVHTLSDAATVSKVFPVQRQAGDADVASKEQPMSVLLIKGAPEVVLSFCYPSAAGSGLSGCVEYQQWVERSEQAASQGMRVIGVCAKLVPRDFALSHESIVSSVTDGQGGCVLTAMLGIIDPPRPEAIDAVKEAQAAGITVKMITGDHPTTALAISAKIGLNTAEGVVTGRQLDAISSQEDFDSTVRKTDVFARTTPEHKLRIVESLRRQGIVCSMTGDGVNDAPALKAANIGVAMGITGTEVAKDAANMIITDDNFATIVDAVKIGRTTYANLIKIITFVLSVNGGQAFSIIGALVIGVAVPITSLQILWVNMLVSVALGIELAFDQPDTSIMSATPRRVDKRIFGRLLSWRVGFASALFVLVVLGVYHWESQRMGHDAIYLRTCSVNAMVISQALYIFNCHHLRSNISLTKMFVENKLIYLGFLCVAVFQVVFTYTSPFQYLFGVKAIDGESWGKIIFLAVCLFLTVEIEKFVASVRSRLC